MNKQAFSKKGTMMAAVAIAMLIGATGAVSAVNAQTTTPAAATNMTTAVTGQSQGNSNGNSSVGAGKSNENPSHEAQESAAWETAENAGKQPWLNPSAYGGNPHKQSSESSNK